MKRLLEIDREILLWINRSLGNGFFDAVMPWWRDKLTWIPLYALFLFLFFRSFGRRAWIPIVMLLLTVGLADFTSSSLIKPAVARLRPCQHPELREELTLRIPCGPGKSFPSAHASNHFAIAVFLIGLFRSKKWRFFAPLLLFWAGSIALGQVYVGVHYPSDVLAGALLGTLIGSLMARLSLFLLHRKLAA